jgi:hypothetical protein
MPCPLGGLWGPGAMSKGTRAGGRTAPRHRRADFREATAPRTEQRDTAVLGRVQGRNAVLSKCHGCGEDAHLEHTLITRG